jgi:hypothetical protein
MLSYSEHGKFRAATQDIEPQKRREKSRATCDALPVCCNILPVKVDHGLRTGAMLDHRFGCAGSFVRPESRKLHSCERLHHQ